MVLKGRADLFQLQAVHILHHSHTVGVAHTDAGHMPRFAVHGQFFVHKRFFAHVYSRQAGRHGTVSAHLHLPQARTLVGDGLQAAEGINGKGLFGNAVGVQPFSHTADAVAAHPALAAVGVENAHHAVRTRCLRSADADDAVRTNGKMPPGQFFGKGCNVLRHTAFAAVQIDIIVGAALHFGK